MLFIKQGVFLFVFVKLFNSLTVEKEMSGKVTGTTKPEKNLQHRRALPVPYQDEVPGGVGAVKQVNTEEQKFPVPCLFRRTEHGWSTSFYSFSRQNRQKNKNKTKQSKS